MIKVRARGTETVQQMMKRFKKMCEKEGLIKDIKRQSYYEKPSEKRRRRNRKSQRVVQHNFCKFRSLRSTLFHLQSKITKVRPSTAMPSTRPLERG